MLLVLNKIVFIFIIMGLGYFVAKIGLLGSNAKAVLSSLLLNLTCPCIIISSMISHPITDDTLSETVWAVILSSVFLFMFLVLSKYLCSNVFHMDRDTSATLAYAIPPSNIGFFGFPVSLAVFGESVLYIFIIENMVLGFYLYLFGVILMEAFSTGGKLSKENISAIMKNPCMWSSIIGLILLCSGVEIPELIYEPMKVLGDATTPLSMILIGVMLSECNFKELISNKGVIILSLIKLFILPVIIFLCVNWLPIPTVVKLGVVFSFSFPCAVMTAPMAAKYGHKDDKCAELIGLTVVLSIITLPLFATLLTMYYGW